MGTVSFAAFIDGRLMCSDAPFKGHENTVFQIEAGELYVLRPGTIERLDFEEVC